jgi:hypothetical protein
MKYTFTGVVKKKKKERKDKTRLIGKVACKGVMRS